MGNQDTVGYSRRRYYGHFEPVATAVIKAQRVAISNAVGGISAVLARYAGQLLSPPTETVLGNPEYDEISSG